MGRNNRQRRAAKKKERARRGTTPDWHRPDDEFADLFADMFADLLDSEDAGDSTEWAATARAATGGHPRGGTVTERAQTKLDSWLAVVARHNGALPAGWARAQPRSVDQAVLDRADELLGHRLLADVAGLWNAGWQPRDLAHVTQRIDRRVALLAADLTIEQAERAGLSDLAPQEWREQLASAALTAASGALRPGPTASRHQAGGERRWLPVTRLIAAGASWEEAMSAALRLLARMERLPALAPTLPPPTAWRSGAAAQTARPPRPGARALGPRLETADGRRDKVLSTVRALLAKAESTDHQPEAEALTSKAQDLMTRHAIDEALLRAGAEEAVEVRSHRVLIDNPYPYEKVALLNQVAGANRVRVIWLADLAMATIVGTPVDVDQVELLFMSLLVQATRAVAEAGAARAGSFDRSPSFRRAFLTSYGIRIGERLTEADQEATSSYGTELVPVLRRQREAVDSEFDRLFPDTYQTGNRRWYDRRGWDAGREAADDAVFVAGRLAG